MKYFFLLFFSLNIYASDITYTHEAKDYQGYYLSAGESAPSILLLHDWDGLTEYEKRRAKMLHELGYSVFVADLFGKGIRPTKVVDKKQHTGELYKDRKKMRALMNAAIQSAKNQKINTKNMVTIGYCFGGAAGLELARSGQTQMKAYFIFHGGLGTPKGQSYKKTQGEVFIYHGAADSMMSMKDFSELAMQLEKHKVKNQMISYGGAPHAFTVLGGHAYTEQADKDSWNHFLFNLKRINKL